MNISLSYFYQIVQYICWKYLWYFCQIVQYICWIYLWYFCQIVQYMGWAQICDQTARAGNWQKWRFQIFFIVNLYQCKQLYISCVFNMIDIFEVWAGMKFRLWHLSIGEAWKKGKFPFFSHTNWHLFKVTPPCRWDNTKERKIEQLNFKKCKIQ